MLNGAYGAEFVRGFQGAGPVSPNTTGVRISYADDGNRLARSGENVDSAGAATNGSADAAALMASSCAKHFLGYVEVTD